MIDAASLADALTRQTGRHLVGSELYALGHCSERDLCSALAQQSGWAAIVIDESTLQLDALAHVSLEWARTYTALPIYEDADTIVIAAARPEDVVLPAEGLSTGKRIELRIALDITLARAIRAAFRLAERGDEVLVGPEAARNGQFLAIIQPETVPSEDDRDAQLAIEAEASRPIERQDELPNEAANSMTFTGDWQIHTMTTTLVRFGDDDDGFGWPRGLVTEALDEQTSVISGDLDRGGEPEVALGRAPRVLVVDPDPTGRMALVAELERLGYECQAAASGPQAMDLLQAMFFDLVFGDVATPGLDGLKLCRAIKGSHRLARVRVVVTTSAIDSGQVSEDELQRHGADGYLEKPLETRRLQRLLRDLSTEERVDHEALLGDVLTRYHAGDLEGAIGRLRGALAGDVASPKLHFMLANMLQRASRWAEAVDEYEAVVDLQPTYFPALTRLAYLYYRQGLHARAVETWRRALPVCDDPELRRSIELFMRKLAAELREEIP